MGRGTCTSIYSATLTSRRAASATQRGSTGRRLLRAAGDNSPVVAESAPPTRACDRGNKTMPRGFGPARGGDARRGFPPRPIRKPLDPGQLQIGRASCRERAEVAGGDATV